MSSQHLPVIDRLRARLERVERTLVLTPDDRKATDIKELLVLWIAELEQKAAEKPQAEPAAQSSD